MIWIVFRLSLSSGRSDKNLFHMLASGLTPGVNVKLKPSRNARLT